MVVAVPAQSQKPVPQLPSDRAANLTSESIPPGFHASHLHGSRVTYFCRPFVFIFLQIPSPATPLFSHPSESLGVLVRTCNSLRNSVPRCLCGKPCCFLLLRTLCPLQKSQVLCNQTNPNSFCKTTGVGVGQRSSALPTTHYPLSLLIQQPAWWKRVQECRCE